MPDNKIELSVIGAANIDIIARCASKSVLRDSNIGKVERSFGGVGRNIVHDCALLGIKAAFISVAGSDSTTLAMMDELAKAGVDTSRVKMSPEYNTGTYVAIFDETGDMLCAVNDMSVTEHISRDYLKSVDIPGRIVALDSNLDSEALEYMTSVPGKVFFADPVSVNKAGRLKGVLRHIDMIKPNVYEASELTGIAIEEEKDIMAAGEKLLKEGVKTVCITCGEKGAYVFSEKESFHAEAPRCDVVNANGAGDAFSAGMLYGMLRGLSLRRMCDFAQCCSAEALSYTGAISPKLNENNIYERMKRTIE
ncbi:MAG: carbohydrate kinase family protein [Eubacteriaceae bacterium]|nr:carbohydrate kinase family protein [Eubacteriaceae bacterium]